jgi:hypothetical protein
MVPSVFAAFENSTVGYSFTPTADLMVVGLRSYSGEKVSLWTDEGILLGTLPPIQLLANRTYRVGVYSAGVTTNYLRFDGFSTFAHGTLNQAYEGAGDAFPTVQHPARWWLVDVEYVVTALPAPIFSEPVSLNGGSWTGPISIPAPGVVYLRASDPGGHIGIANVFSVAESLRLEIVRSPSGEVKLRFQTATGRDYAIETSSTLASESWLPFGTTIPGTGGIIERPLSSGGAPAFFRLKRTP